MRERRQSRTSFCRIVWRIFGFLSIFFIMRALASSSVRMCLWNLIHFLSLRARGISVKRSCMTSGAFWHSSAIVQIELARFILRNEPTRFTGSPSESKVALVSCTTYHDRIFCSQSYGLVWVSYSKRCHLQQQTRAESEAL